MSQTTWNRYENTNSTRSTPGICLASDRYLFVLFSVNDVVRSTVSVLREAAVVDVDIIVVGVVQSA
jgi:hypothetical protein